MLGLWRLNATFNNIYVTLWRSDILVTEHRAPGTSLKIPNPLSKSRSPMIIIQWPTEQGQDDKQ
jgi:hypothetical protein